jgi:MinD-like ATPase involved in chromosome partitioning or flagellar assembly
VSTRAVTIAGSEGRVDVVVPAETPIADLLPTFLDLGLEERPDPAGPQPVWAVSPPGGAPLAGGQTLADAGVSDGDVLSLVQLRSAEQSPPRPRERHRRPEPARRGSPRERTQAVLPRRMSGSERLSEAVKAFFGHGPQEPVLESSAPAEPTAQQRLTRPEEPGATERWRASRRETAYLARLDRAVAAPRLGRCATIAVVSPKGGVGKTTTTALLGSLFARVRRDRIVAVDTNPDFGSLGRTLTPDHRLFVDDLIEVLGRPNLSVTELDRHLGRGPEGMMVLPAPTDPARMARLDEPTYRAVIERLQALVGVLVLDCGTGLQEPAARAAQATADQILLVTDAHPSTASLVAEAADLLRTVGPPITLLVNKMPDEKRSRLDLSALEELVPEAQGLVTFADVPRAAAHVAEGAFAWEDAPESWQTAVRELAVVLASDWPRLGLAR